MRMRLECGNDKVGGGGGAQVCCTRASGPSAWGRGGGRHALAKLTWLAEPAASSLLMAASGR